ncbi:hypothetical protein [Stutzerimonas balearica]|uniref:hypothetical protein n=1 Tax=Stutzerimonas balearica TaxID=74829 RepID=UPI001F515800|nr:hypothetical protein [Stutzerimonas balearica]
MTAGAQLNLCQPQAGRRVAVGERREDRHEAFGTLGIELAEILGKLQQLTVLRLALGELLGQLRVEQRFSVTGLELCESRLFGLGQLLGPLRGLPGSMPLPGGPAAVQHYADQQQSQAERHLTRLRPAVAALLLLEKVDVLHHCTS